MDTDRLTNCYRSVNNTAVYFVDYPCELLLAFTTLEMGTCSGVNEIDSAVGQARDLKRRASSAQGRNHLFVGDKLNGNTDSLDIVLPITSQFTDVVLYQMYGQYGVQKPGQDRWSRIANQPIINGDALFTMITEHMPRAYGPVADNLEQRAEWTAEFFWKAFARPEFVDWHYCVLIDAPT